MMTGFLILSVAYGLGLVLAPFPHWPTWFRLWHAVLFLPAPWSAKLRQAQFLLQAAAAAPLRSLLWYLDELLFPAYRQGTFEPVFIIGQPRCGSTLLHRTLAADESTFFAVRHIEWRYPYICVQKLIRFFGLDRRLAAANYWPDSAAGRRAAKMHPNTLADWEEDGIFFEENYLHHFFIFLRFPYPALLGYLESFPEMPEALQERMLRTHRKVLQKVQYLRGSGAQFYLSKEVTSHNKIPALMRLYPQARFVVITRAANDFMASLMALVRTSTQTKTGVDPDTIGGWREAVIDRMREDSRRLVELCQSTIPVKQQVRVHARYFMANIDKAVAAIYRQLNLALPDEVAARLQWLRKTQDARTRDYDYDPISLQGFDAYDTFVQTLAERVVGPVEPVPLQVVARAPALVHSADRPSDLIAATR